MDDEMEEFCETCGEEERYVHVGKPEGKNHLKALDVDGRIILK
jgi:hypothetical protein